MSLLRFMSFFEVQVKSQMRKNIPQVSFQATPDKGLRARSYKI